MASSEQRTVLFAAAACGVALYGLSRLLLRPAPGARRRLQFVPWKLVDVAAKAGNSGILAVDCKHPHLPCLTHHKTKEEQMPPKNLRGDTSSDMVLNALQQQSTILTSASAGKRPDLNPQP
ncbi:hypothetical protein T484DRAFT_1785607 [Baffinella frigidus]|nr:hypothetical protein T484DRAFT_1785607 [Cryptophyta sp. CCMP2293]